MNDISQFALHNALLTPINPHDPKRDDAQASRLFAAKLNFSHEVIALACKADAETVTSYFDKKVVPLFDPTKLRIAVLALYDLIANDSVIQPDVIVDVASGATKRTLSSQSCFVPERFLAGVFLYSVRAVPNRAGLDNVQDITDEYFNMFSS
jgi:hypothetical protein